MNRLLPFACLFLGLAFGPVSAQESPAPDPAGNLLTNPGFEQGPSPWEIDNWAKNEGTYTLDPTNPHSGQESAHVILQHVTGARPAYPLVYRHLPLKPGMALQLRFWSRGPANTEPITVSLQKAGAPYTSYFLTQVGLSGDWTESVFNLLLPPEVDTRDTSLIFQLNAENQFWLDDVSLTELPAQSTEPPLAGNRIKNGSFEVGRDHWYATFRENNGAQDMNTATEYAAKENIVVQSAADAPDGHHVLAFEVFPACRVDLTSAYFHLRYGHPVSVNFWLKARAGAKFQASLSEGKYPNQLRKLNDFTSATDQWTSYHLTATPSPSTAGAYFFEFASQDPAPYELDGVSVTEGDSSATAFVRPPLDLGWTEAGPTPAGNLYYPDDTIRFVLNLAMPPGPKTETIGLRLVDYREHTLHSWQITVPVDAEGYGHAPVSLPSDLQGGFKVEARAADAPVDSLPKTELVYSVMPKLKPPAEETESFFGGHADFTPYNLDIAEKVGFRWLRMHPPLSTKWMTVEATKGRFDFYTDGATLANRRGFRILGSFDTTPGFYADGDPKKTQQAKWFDSYGPKDWTAYRAYVQKTAAAFAPYIWNWEIWNEPDGGFLQVPPGVDKAQRYVKILTETRQALQDGGFHEYLVGGAVAHFNGPFTWKELALGGNSQVDAFSFHYYGEEKSPDEAQPPLPELLARVRAFPNRSGQVPPLWESEGGIWINGGRSWLNSAEIPSFVVTTIEDAASTLARTDASLKAMGVVRYCFYGAFAAPSGGIDYRDECSGMIGTDGIPSPAGAANAVAVHFLEDARPVGLEKQDIGSSHVTFARFRTDDTAITVLWARIPLKLGQLAKAEWEGAAGYEIMGNPLKLSADTEVNIDPIYLVRKNAPPSSTK
jgi:hypothetical protein